MRIFVVLLFAILNLNTLVGQDCGTETNHSTQMMENSSYKKGYLKQETYMNSLKKENLINRFSNAQFTIPVVVHILHRGENIPPNTTITDNLINKVIDNVNRDYDGLQVPTFGITPETPPGIDMEIDFCLANVDPNGQPSNGINRVDATIVPGYFQDGIGLNSAFLGVNPNLVQDLSAWPTSDYLNIWVVHKINGAGAYAFFPNGDKYDGVVSDEFSFDSSILTHEIGHWLHLFHTFNGDNDGQSCPQNIDCTIDGDQVCDTPPHIRTGCISPVCSSPPEFYNNSYNFMAYCANQISRFTQGQKDRMIATLNGPIRGSLQQSQGCSGVDLCEEFGLTAVLTQPSCSNTNGGAIDLEVIGGTPPYEYSWGNSFSLQDRENIIAGTWIVDVTDANNCEVRGIFTLENTGIFTPCDDGNSCTTNEMYDQNCNCVGTEMAGAECECPDGSYEWEDIRTIFQNNGCLGCHGFQGGLNLSTYSNTIMGGNSGLDGCGIYTNPLALLLGKVDGTLSSMENCGSPMPLGSASFGQQSISDADLEALRTWIDDGAPEFCNSDCTTEGLACNDNNGCTTGDVFDANCNCAGTFQDSDGDGVCDVFDVCPGFNDNIDSDNDGTPDGCDDCDTNLAGTTCNDNNECTTGDVFDANCNCAGTFQDSDGDGVCDASDVCPGFNDNIDSDNDGTPDGCDDCDTNLAGTACNDNNECTTGDVFDANCNCAGTFQDSDGDGVCDASDVCPGFNDNIDSDNDGTPDGCDDCDTNLAGTTCNDNNECTTGDVFDANCNCAGTFQDSDGDGVCDAFDVCPGFNDNIDSDNDGTPDGCDDCDTNLAGTTCNDNNECTTGDVFDANCNCAGTFQDSDGDGVCDAFDVCPGFNDNIDSDNDGTPDGCDDCDTNLAGTTCNDNNECTTGDVFDANCNCAGTFQDSDGDGVCDASDVCPGFNDNIDSDNDGTPDGCDDCDTNLAGTACNDNNECTTGDVFDANCNCAGTFQDSDGDGVCDASDVCPGFNDNIDSDNDGTPDGCDDCDNIEIVIDSQGESCESINELTANVTNGLGQITYSWDTNESTPSITVTNPGTYSVTVVDENNCSASSEITIEFMNIIIVNVDIVNDACADANSASLFASGGTPPYSFSWSNGLVSNNVNNLSSGTYTITVEDAVGCTTVSNIQIGDNSSPIVVDGVLITPILCSSVGEIDLLVSGGTPPYIYEYAGVQFDIPINSYTEGFYTITIIDANECSIDTSIFLPADSYELEVDETSIITKCVGEENVNIQVDQGEYEIIWNNGVTENELLNVSEGVYTYTLTDEFGCTGSSTIVVIEPDTIKVDLELVNSTNGQNGSAVAVVDTPNIPISIMWSTGQSGQEIENLSPGAYFVTVTDKYDCNVILEFFIEDETPNSTNPTLLQKFEVYPNPADRNLIVSLVIDYPVPYNLEIVDVLGRGVWKQNDLNSSSIYSIDLTDINSGTYYCLFKSDQQIEIRKVVVMK